MMGLYVLEIPNLGYVINQDTVSRWEVFLQHPDRGSRKIHWQASSAASGFIFRNVSAGGSPVEWVKIDFAANRIVIRKKSMEDRKFQRFLRFLLDTFFIRVGPDEMHFVVSMKGLRRHNVVICQ